MISLEISLTNTNIFVTRSVNSTSRVWGIRSGKCLHNNVGHEYYIKLVLFFPYGNSFGTVSDDST